MYEYNNYSQSSIDWRAAGSEMLDPADTSKVLTTSTFHSKRPGVNFKPVAPQRIANLAAS